MASLHSLWQRIVPTFTVVKHMGTKETKLNINQNISRNFFSGCMWEMVFNSNRDRFQVLKSFNECGTRVKHLGGESSLLDHCLWCSNS